MTAKPDLKSYRYINGIANTLHCNTLQYIAIHWAVRSLVEEGPFNTTQMWKCDGTFFFPIRPPEDEKEISQNRFLPKRTPPLLLIHPTSAALLLLLLMIICFVVIIIRAKRVSNCYIQEKKN